jgi:hypothetical protein
MERERRSPTGKTLTLILILPYSLTPILGYNPHVTLRSTILLYKSRDTVDCISHTRSWVITNRVLLSCLSAQLDAVWDMVTRTWKEDTHIHSHSMLIMGSEHVYSGCCSAIPEKWLAFSR